MSTITLTDNKLITDYVDHYYNQLKIIQTFLIKLVIYNNNIIIIFYTTRFIFINNVYNIYSLYINHY